MSMLYINSNILSGVYVNEEDIANYTIKAMDGSRTLNKILYMRPSWKVLSFNLYKMIHT